MKALGSGSLPAQRLSKVRRWQSGVAGQQGADAHCCTCTGSLNPRSKIVESKKCQENSRDRSTALTEVPFIKEDLQHVLPKMCKIMPHPKLWCFPSGSRFLPCCRLSTLRVPEMLGCHDAPPVADPRIQEKANGITLWLWLLHSHGSHGP